MAILDISRCRPLDFGGGRFEEHQKKGFVMLEGAKLKGVLIFNHRGFCSFPAEMPITPRRLFKIIDSQARKQGDILVFGDEISGLKKQIVSGRYLFQEYRLLGLKKVLYHDAVLVFETPFFQ